MAIEYIAGIGPTNSTCGGCGVRFYGHGQNLCDICTPPLAYEAAKPIAAAVADATAFLGPMKTSLMNMRPENLLDERDRCLGYIEEIEYRRRQAALSRPDGEAIAGTGGVRVKPLEWTQLDNGSAWAHTLFGISYHVRPDGSWCERNGDWAKAGSTLDEAKAAVHADFDNRIRASLANDAPPIAAAAQVEAVDEYKDMVYRVKQMTDDGKVPPKGSSRATPPAPARAPEPTAVEAALEAERQHVMRTYPAGELRGVALAQIDGIAAALAPQSSTGEEER